jgi:nucleoside-diphosphate-sugar epimerase
VPETCSTDYCGQSAFEWSKLIGERYVDYYARARSLRACIFRMSTVYARPSEGNEPGFVTHYVESVKRGWPIRLPLGGSPVRDILHVDDFSRACRAFIDSSLTSGLYNLGGGRRNSATLLEIVETIGRLIELEPVIDEEARVPRPIPLNYISDLTRIRDELSWQPKIGIEEGLRSLL